MKKIYYNAYNDLKRKSYPIYFEIKKFLNLHHIHSFAAGIKPRYPKHYKTLMADFEKNRNRKRIFYIGIPIHNNLGDQAQYLCILEWIHKNYKDYAIIEIPDVMLLHNYKNILGKLKNYATDDDIFIFQSGYRTTDICNYVGEHAHERTLNTFKNKVIVFPQTVNFKSQKLRKKSIEAYQNNNNYIFMARDNTSYNIALKMYDKKKVLLYPDIVTTLIGEWYKPTQKSKRDGILMCLRNDSEKLYTNKQYANLINRLKTITPKIDITDTDSNEEFEFDRSKASYELQKKLDQFSNYKLIITDRFHGTIFSLITNTPVIVLDSTDHKLSSGVNWFKGLYDDRVFYCTNFEDVYDLAKKIYGKNNKAIKGRFFQKHYYDNLINIINE